MTDNLKAFTGPCFVMLPVLNAGGEMTLKFKTSQEIDGQEFARVHELYRRLSETGERVMLSFADEKAIEDQDLSALLPPPVSEGPELGEEQNQTNAGGGGAFVYMDKQRRAAWPEAHLTFKKGLPFWLGDVPAKDHSSVRYIRFDESRRSQAMRNQISRLRQAEGLSDDEEEKFYDRVMRDLSALINEEINAALQRNEQP